MFDQTEARLAGLNVPRYTSYPTAPHFDASVGPEDYTAWLRDLTPNSSLSIYLHVPYCQALCHYCGCNTRATRRQQPVDAYCDLLLEEIALVARHCGARRVVNLHWGGGTPSIMGAAQLYRVFDALWKAFDISPSCTHAIELDPRKVDEDFVHAMVGIGVNRASFGVQEFAPRVQRAMGRVQPYRVVEQAISTVRDAGIGNFNIDLMYGLPEQRLEDVRRSAELAAALKPQRLACFGYAHVPWLKKHQELIDETALPDPMTRFEQAAAIRETLTANGYEPIGIDHFARADDDLALATRAGRLRRNFQGYTTDDADALVGLGASSIGRFPRGFVQNRPDVAGYRRALASGALATERGLRMSESDHVRARIIERLMCDFGVDLGEVVMGEKTRTELFPALESLKTMAHDGLVELADETIRVTDRGRPFVRLVASAFDAYLPKRPEGHSKAI